LEKDINENLGKYAELTSRLPTLVDQMINTYEECLLDSTPDKTADYFEEKDHLQECSKNLRSIKTNLDKIDRAF
jgi:hypothetical protein